MSYSIGIEPTARDEVVAVLGAKVEEHLAANSEAYAIGEQSDHLNSVLEALERVLPTLGRSEDLVRVSVSGHANEGHAPSDSWADEALTISLTVVRQ